jgi:anti-sigma-K factor RskA
MNSADVHTLTGAYAVDALDGEELERFEAHLEECGACRREVEELQATAAQLGSASFETPPAHLKGDVMAAIDRTRQLPPLPRPRPEEDATSATPLAARRPWHQRLLAPAAAVLALVVIGQTAIIANMSDRLGSIEATAPVDDLLGAADLMTVEVDDGGTRARLLASPTMGEGMFVVDGMTPAPGEQDYQLWLITADAAIPAGIVEIVDGHGMQMVTGDIASVVALGVTMEPAGGSSQPTSDPIMLVEMPPDT